jgi:hypothetical protein
VTAWTPILLRSPGEDWERIERQLDADGVPFPLPSRAAWARHLGNRQAWLIAAQDANGRFGAALAVEIQGTRALPGHYLWRAHHIGRGLVGDAGEAVLQAVRDIARATPRVLGVNLEFILRDAAEHEQVGKTLRRLGFRHVPLGRNYSDTIAVSLEGTEDEILAGFSWSTRRTLKQWSRQGFELRPITDPGFAQRLNAIAHETFVRTGGAWEPRDWPARMRLSEAEPAHSRLVGFFRAGRDDPESLLGFAWACAHGDFAHYDDGGSARAPDIGFTLACPLLWDLMRWARASGCKWFDMGGVTAQGQDAAGTLKGIEEFKLRFSKTRIRAGAEWQLDSRPRLRRLAERIRQVANLAGMGAR